MTDRLVNIKISKVRTVMAKEPRASLHLRVEKAQMALSGFGLEACNEVKQPDRRCKKSVSIVSCHPRYKSRATAHTSSQCFALQTINTYRR